MQSKNEALVVSIAHIPVFFSYQSYYICVVEITENRVFSLYETGHTSGCEIVTALAAFPGYNI